MEGQFIWRLTTDVIYYVFRQHICLLPTYLPFAIYNGKSAENENIQNENKKKGKIVLDIEKKKEICNQLSKTETETDFISIANFADTYTHNYRCSFTLCKN